MVKKTNIIEASTRALDAVKINDQAQPQEINELKLIMKRLVVEHGGEEKDDGSVIANENILRKVASEIGIYHKTLNNFIVVFYND
mgnify:CR=1 FL=1